MLTVKDFLAKAKIDNISTIAAKGGLQNIKDLPLKPNSAAYKRLAAHTQLGLVSQDFTRNDKIYKKGYTSISQIARTPSAVFVEEVGAEIGNFRAYAFQASIRHTAQYMDNLVAYQQVATGRQDLPDVTQDLFPAPPCECEDCNSAVSPLAYLAELLDYVLDYVRKDGDRLTTGILDDLFHQPFGDLPVECELMEQQFCQMRLATEILWKEYTKVLGTIPQTTQDALDKDVATYTSLTYRTLLEKLGTSYEEIRLIRHQKPGESTADFESRRKKLSNRIGVDLIFDPTGTATSTLDSLFIDLSPSAIPISEGDLEQLFGYRNTTRLVLSQAPTGDLETWRLAHLKTLWTIQDLIDDEFSRGESPIVDPDNIGIDDMRNPASGESIFDLWEQRRRWVDDLLESFSVITTKRGIYRASQSIQIDNEDLSSDLAEGDTITISGSTGNDGNYTVLSSKYDKGRSMVSLQEAIPSIVSDGSISYNKEYNIYSTSVSKITIANVDLTSDIQTGQTIEITNSTSNNNNPYTVTSISVQGGNTELEVQGRLNLSNSEGQLVFERSIPIGGIVIPNIEALLNRMYQPVAYGATTIPEIWNSGLPSNLFQNRYSLLTSGSVSDVELVSTDIQQHLLLDVDAFKRLMEISEKDRLHANDPYQEKVSEEEWDEVYDILANTAKKRVNSIWTVEESSNSIELNPKDFWQSLNEPEQGKWSPINLHTPLIDPAIVSTKELPEYTAGQPAIQLLRSREVQLKGDYLELEIRRVNSGIDTSIEWALGVRNAGDPALPDIDQIQSNLSSSDVSLVQAAESTVKSSLFMEVNDFKRMMAIRSKLSTDSKPTDEEWKEVYTILNQANKTKRRYPTWIIEETNVNLEYWQAYKAKLPKWRSSFEQRAIWQNALKRRSVMPTVDPTILFPIDFSSIDPAANAAYQLYLARKQEVNAQKAILEAVSQDLSGIEINLVNTLGVSIAVFEGLSDAQQLGEDIRSRLQQLNLDRDSFSQLLMIRSLAQNSNPILEEEWTEFYNILLKVWKERKYRIWQMEEENSAVIHTAEFFKVPEPTPASFPLPEPLETEFWITDPRDRKRWQRKLKSRISQSETVKQSLYNAIEETADETMGLLRDSIIKAINKPAKYLSDHLLVDVENNCCQKMTRVSLAMEALQKLLWSLHLGILEDSYPNMDLISSSFEEEWQWIGSYSTWRAAMFVFIYPENILIPSLRKWQSPGFRSMVNNIRRNRRLNPEKACEYAKKYSAYYKDISNLEIQSTCTSRTKIMGNSCRDKSVSDYRCLYYKFALSNSKKVYWSIYDQNNPSGYADSFWATVPGLEHDVLEICGSPAYRYSEDERHIFLFLKYKDGRDTKIGYTKYNLETLSWDGGIEELEVPKKAFHFKSLCIQTSSESKAPQVIFQISDAEDRVYNGGIYKRNLNEKAEDWEEGEWDDFQIVSARKGRGFDVNSVVEVNNGEFIIIFKNAKYRVFGNYDDGKIRSFRNNGVSLGSTYWRSSNSLYAFYNDSTGNTKYKEILRSTSNPYANTISNISEFNEWLIAVYGLSLKHHTLTDSQGLAIKNIVDNFTEDGIGSVYDLFEFYEQNSNLGFLSWIVSIYIRNLVTWLTEQDSELFDRSPDWKYLNKSFRSLSNVSLKVALIRMVIQGNDFAVRKRDVSAELRSQNGWSSISILAKDYGVNIGKKVVNKNISFQKQNDSSVLWRRSIKKVGIDLTSNNEGTQLTPVVSSYYDIPEILSENDLAVRKTTIEQFFFANQGAPTVVLDYLREAYYFVPVHLAMQLQGKSHYISALNYFKSVYDYTRPSLSERKIYYGLVLEESLATGFDRAEDWMLDPLNPHGIAGSRSNVYTTFTKLAIARCLLDYADSEFTYDTSESVPRARELYEEALELLDSLKPADGECDALIGLLDIEISDGEWNTYWQGVIERVRMISDVGIRSTLIAQILVSINNDRIPIQERFRNIDTHLDDARAAVTPTPILEVVERNNRILDSAYMKLSTNALVENVVLRVQGVAQADYVWKQQAITGKSVSELIKTNAANTPKLIAEDIRIGTPLNTEYALILSAAVTSNITQGLELAGSLVTTYIPRPFVTQFCIPPNPIIKALCLKAEVNLYKIRNCMNIAGIERKLDPYAAPTDTSSGLPSIGAGGQLVLPGTVNLPPTPYRYNILIERAKQLVSLAQQVEASFLSAIEKFDAESYNMLKAKQDLQMAKAGIRLQDLRVKEAKDGVKLSELTLQKSELQIQGLNDMIGEGLLGSEQTMIVSYIVAGAAQVASIIAGTLLEASNLATKVAGAGFGAAVAAAAAVPGFGAIVVRGAANSIAAGANTTAQVASVYASLERRIQDWEYQKSLAQQDLKIGKQQIKLSEDRVRIVGQEREISKLQKENAQETIDFLRNKFTNAELYDWMSNILEGVYSFFLQQATTTAQQALNQLAFERQELPPPIIQTDYWESPASDSISSIGGGGSQDRRGLTGSARLLQDIYDLDQLAFSTNKRKEELTKTISLSSLSPIAFQNFKETGVMTFATPMEMFDRDFPGHFLRLIKKIKVSVIALTPSTAGIKATLSNTGLSRVVIGGDIFQNVQIRRAPESISLSTPREATGMFELQQANEFLNPFEYQGVDSFWEFRMEKASNSLNYGTIADVYMTIEYTAFNSFDYRAQVVQNLGTEVSLDLPLSLRNNFADQWYDLHNPDTTSTPLTVNLNIDRVQFPPNINEFNIEQVALYIAFKDQSEVIPVELSLRFNENGSSSYLGGSTVTDEGKASTRSGNAGSWISMIGKQPFGTFELSLPDNFRSRRLFEEELIDDIIIVISYGGVTPDWS